MVDDKFFRPSVNLLPWLQDVSLSLVINIHKLSDFPPWNYKGSQPGEGLLSSVPQCIYLDSESAPAIVAPPSLLLPVAGVEVVPLVASAPPVVVGGPVVGLVVGVLGLLVVEASSLLVVTSLSTKLSIQSKRQQERP